MVVQDSFSILVLLKGHKMCSNRISNRFNSTQQQHIWNSTKNVCRSVSAKVMNSERKSSILQRHPSQIFCRTLKMPLVYTSRSFPFNLLYIKDENPSEYNYWACAIKKFWEFTGHHFQESPYSPSGSLNQKLQDY